MKPPPKTIRCTKCEKRKLVCKFPPEKRKLNGRSSWCHVCKRVLVRIWGANNPDKKLAESRRWYANNPKKCRAAQRRYRKANPEKVRAGWKRHDKAHPQRGRVYRLKKYGLTIQDYQLMYAQQGGRCAICGEQYKTLAVDHCHQSGRVRGLLCNPCNKGLGHFKDNHTRMVMAARYLQRMEG